MRKNFQQFINQNSSGYYARLTKFIKQLVAGSLRNQGLPLINSFKRLSLLMGLNVNLSLIKVIITYLRFCSLFIQRSSVKQLCLYLKVCSLMLQQSIGGHILLNLSPLGIRPARSRSGLPRIIPSLHRERIRKGEYKIIQFWNTLFALYRVLNFPGVLKLQSIIKPGVHINYSETRLYLDRFFFILNDQTKVFSIMKDFIQTFNLEPFIIFKSGPSLIGTKTTRFMSGGLVSYLAASKLIVESDLFPIFNKWFALLGQENPVNHLSFLWDKYSNTYFKDFKLGSLGKLGFKNEAAGKVRVFAMVDNVTQWMLRPIHDLIFSILRKLPTDGTFDQTRPLELLLKNLPKGKPLYSFDLSSATDRLPVEIQRMLLSFLIGEEFSILWRDLLVSRSYSYSSSQFNVKGEVKYAVGQPMGALSSWAMLALTHHFLVQQASFMAYKSMSWFDSYCILGDDLIIADSRVAKKYLDLCRIYGIDINLSKSIISLKGKSLEFAKRTYYKGVDVSPLTLKEYWMSFTNVQTLANLAFDYKLSLSTYLSVLGVGYKAKSLWLKPFDSIRYKHSRLVDRLFLYNSPFVNGAPISMESYLSMNSLFTFPKLEKAKEWVYRLTPKGFNMDTFNYLDYLKSLCEFRLDTYNDILIQQNDSALIALLISKELKRDPRQFDDLMIPFPIDSALTIHIRKRIEDDRVSLKAIINEISTYYSSLNLKEFIDLLSLYENTFDINKPFRSVDTLVINETTFLLKAQKIIRLSTSKWDRTPSKDYK